MVVVLAAAGLLFAAPAFAGSHVTVPEPASLGLYLAGVGGLGAVRAIARRFRRD